MILNESMKKTITLKESELISLIERMVKEAEEARRRQSKFELDMSDFRNEETHIY